MLDQKIPFVDLPEKEQGDWRIKKFEVPTHMTIEAARLALVGRAIRPGIYTALQHTRRGTVMSDTPAEKRDHMAFVHAATGHVLINGLGLGMSLKAVLLKPDVTAVTVVEIDPDVMALVAPHYQDPRVVITLGDALTYQPPYGRRYGAVWNDIWDTIGAENLPDMARLHRKYSRRAEWVGSWCRAECKREQRRERENERFYSAFRR